MTIVGRVDRTIAWIWQVHGTTETAENGSTLHSIHNPWREINEMLGKLQIYARGNKVMTMDSNMPQQCNVSQLNELVQKLRWQLPQYKHVGDNPESRSVLTPSLF